jgi:subtilisin family serine protease/Ca2+-binding RTX toxin-like protein
MARRSNRSDRPARNADRVSRSLGLAIEPLEERWLLAANLGRDLEVLAAATPFQAAELSTLNLSSATSNGREVPALSGQWVVKLAAEPGASLAGSLASASKVLGEHVRGLRSVEGLASTDTFLIRTASNYNYSLPGITAMLVGIKGFASVEPNFLAWKDDTTPNDPSFADQWALHNTGQLGGTVDADIDAPAAWDINTGSGKAVIGVVDSGVDYNHPDLNDNMWHNPGEIPGDGIDNDGNGFVDDVFGYDFLNGDSDPLDDEGHGTSVAGIIAGEGNNALGVSGVNWDAQIMALKIFDPLGFAGTAQIVAAINYATMMKLHYGVNVVVTNHSWGTVGYSTVLHDAIAASGLADILFVASAGNGQHDNDIAPQYPASFDLPNIIAVAATDRSDNRASFTSFGETTVDLGAPGVSTFTTALGGGYRNFSGTSASAPYVTGVVALVHDTYPKATALEVKQAILDGVDPIAAMAGITVTGGRLNLFGALKAMQMQVIAASPDDGDVVPAPPLAFSIKTAFAIDPATLNASDLTVNGIPANNVMVVGTTATFSYLSSPVTSQGAQQLHIVAGAFQRLLDSSPVKEFDATFHYDTLSLEVISTVPAPGPVTPWPVSSIQFVFNEVVSAASVDIGDLKLSQGSVSGFNVAGNTVTYQLAGMKSDRRLTVELAAGAVTDGTGNPNLPFSTTLEVDAGTITAAPFARLEPLGGLIFVSTNEGRLFGAADVDQFDFFVQAGQTLAFRVTPLDGAASMTAQLLGIGGVVASPAAGQPAISAPVPVNGSGIVSLRIGGDRATDYRVEIFRNSAIENPAAGVPQDIAGSALELGSKRFAVVGSIGSAGQTDRFSLDLTASLGQPVDVVLAGQAGVSFAGATLELVAPDGTLVAAMADQLGNGATNYDLAILGYVPNQVGVYELRLTSSVLGQYAIVVTERLLFESEVNDGPLGFARSLDVVHSVAGFVNPFGNIGPFEFIVDATMSSLTISGGVGTPEQGILVPFTEQAPGSLQSNLMGKLHAIVSNNSIVLLPEANIFPFEKPGPFQPGNLPADFAAALNFPPIIVGGVLALRDTAFGMVVDGLSIAPNGEFAANQMSFVVRETFAAMLPGVFVDTVEVDDTFVDNQALAPGSLRFVDGRLELVLPIQVQILFPVPQLPAAGIFNLVGQVVARAIVPGTDDDYLLTLAPGQTVNIETKTPFDDPASTPGNTLNPALALLNDSGVVVASDADSAADGKNARLQFTSANGGTYRVRVLSTSGQGEYVLTVGMNSGPTLEAIDDKTVAEGSKLEFTAHATSGGADQLTFSLAPGAPAGAAINPTTGKFTWTPQDDTGGPFPITVIVTDNGSPQLSDSQSFAVTVTNIAPSIKSVALTPSTAKEGDLVSLKVTFTDPGVLDTHTATVQWGDGTSGPATVTKSGSTFKFVAQHAYSSGGNYDVSFAIADDDGGSATGGSSVLVSGVGIHQRDGKTVLEVVGTDGNDSVTITQLWNNRLYVYASFLPGSGRTVSMAGLDLIEVLGLGGNDYINLGSLLVGVNVPAIVDGGDGNDTIYGGNGGNVLLGGRGNDLLVGGTARDLLIGGEGADLLYGNGADDILIAGLTSYDAPTTGVRRPNDAALLALLKEWSSSRSYNQRTANIVAGSGPVLGPLGVSLKKGLTVFDDNQADWLLGSAGQDWYFHDSRDLVLFKSAGEKVNN